MKNKMYDQFTGKYSLQKTLRFELIPQGKTLEHIEKNGLIEEDTMRADDYIEIKKLIDDYHRDYIERALKDVELSSIDKYVAVYNNPNHTADDLEKCAEVARKEIVSFLSSQPEYSKLFKGELIKEILPAYCEDNEEALTLIEKFRQFTPYFTGFNENRKNIYTDEAKSTAIGFRVINQNLPKFIDNYNTLKKALEYPDIADGIKSIGNDFEDILRGSSAVEYLSPDNYSAFVSQKGIDAYNTILGGKTLSDREKIQGINEYINLHNQKVNRTEKVGTSKPLYKQILSDRQSTSYLPEQFEDGEQVIEAVLSTHNELQQTLLDLQDIITEISSYDLGHIYIKNDVGLSDISAKVYGEWNHINEALTIEYDQAHKPAKIKDYDKYIEKRNKALKKIKSYSIEYLQEICGDEKIVEYLSNEAPKLIKFNDEKKDSDKEKYGVEEAYSKLENAQKNNSSTRTLSKNRELVAAIKDYLDALKEVQRFIKPLLGFGDESEKDARFYGELEEAWMNLDTVTPLYNKVRNYVTKKPYSTEKIKLNFGNSTLLAGWDLNKETANASIVLRRDGNYYLGIMSRGNTAIFQSMEEENCQDYYEKMEYKLLPGANKMLPKVFFSKSRIDEFEPSQEILTNYTDGTHKKGESFNLSHCHMLIDFFKTSINKHEDWKNFQFQFSPTNQYKDMSDFYREVEDQGYKVGFKKIPYSVIESFVEEGKLYLFQIYNKDFSTYSKGTPNLHTLYWKALFSEENLKNVVYKLNGEAEVFYRKASIEDGELVVHDANKPIANKNKLNDKATSTFTYDIIKDKRYTVDKFQFHVPITLNFKAHGWDNINLDARQAIKDNKNNYVIGIDRGERHLLYISVIDSEGRIVEQRTLNQIVSESPGKELPPIDYHALLDEREKKRDEERKNWQTIENIKELKEGYLSQVVHYIATLMVKYNAIVVLENLNSGFKRSRQKVEKQVYQKFEKMLIDKLNYLVDKRLPENEEGGLMHAYQLTSKFDGFNKLGRQSGMLFYTEAWNTSKIDPVTGFVNLFDTRYKNVKATQDFWSKFDSIEYDTEKDMFAFSFKYSNFTQRNLGAKDDWIIYTNGERIKSYKNNQGKWDFQTVDLTQNMKDSLSKVGINYKDADLQKQIVDNNDKLFHEALLSNFKLMLQMRNSISGTEVDYIVSPAIDSNGNFFDSRNGNPNLPLDADANGAYNIARKGLMIIDRIKSTPDDKLSKADLFILNTDWLKFAQGLTD